MRPINKQSTCLYSLYFCNPTAKVYLVPNNIPLIKQQKIIIITNIEDNHQSIQLSLQSLLLSYSLLVLPSNLSNIFLIIFQYNPTFSSQSLFYESIYPLQVTYALFQSHTSILLITYLNYTEIRMNSSPKTHNSHKKFDLKTNHSDKKGTKLSPHKVRKSQQYTTQTKKIKRVNYHWTALEHQRYINFLIAQGHLFNLPYEQKIKLKIQVMMSNEIQKRNSTQCRSHHQKMLARFGSIQNIIKNHYQQRQGSKSVKAEQALASEMLQLKNTERQEERVECKIEQQEQNFYVNLRNSEFAAVGEPVMKEQEQVFYRTFV